MQRFMFTGIGAVVLNTVAMGSAQAMNLRFAASFSDLHPSAGPDGTLQLVSGDQITQDVPDGDFDIDEIGEYFDLEIDSNHVGRFGCYDALDVINLNGDTSGEGCSFDQTFSFVNDFGLDLTALINEDGSLFIDAIFSEDVELSPLGNNLTFVLSYGIAVPPTPVPTPAAVLPVLSGLFSAARRKSKTE